MADGRDSFEQWIEGLRVKRKATKGELAKAVGLHPTGFGRQVKKGSLGWRPLLKLALAIGASPSEVLRRAGKTAEAELIEACYGPPRTVAPAIREVTDLLRGDRWHGVDTNGEQVRGG